MAEIKKVWLVTDSADSRPWADPALQKPDGSPDEESIMFQFLDPEGMSIDRFIRIVQGTQGNTWDKEKSKVYSDLASAQKDADARFKRLMSKMPKKAYSYDHR